MLHVLARLKTLSYRRTALAATFALAAATAVAGAAAPAAAGTFHGGGFHGGGFHGGFGGFHGGFGGFHGGFRHDFDHRFGFRRFDRDFRFDHRFGFRRFDRDFAFDHRFRFGRRFAFGGPAFFAGYADSYAGYDDCWRRVWGPYGWRLINICY
jgi:hypothetical protein